MNERISEVMKVRIIERLADCLLSHVLGFSLGYWPHYSLLSYLYGMEQQILCQVVVFKMRYLSSLLDSLLFC